jgi:hypothetical protein
LANVHRGNENRKGELEKRRRGNANWQSGNIGRRGMGIGETGILQNWSGNGNWQNWRSGNGNCEDEKREIGHVSTKLLMDTPHLKTRLTTMYTLQPE